MTWSRSNLAADDDEDAPPFLRYTHDKVPVGEPCKVLGKNAAWAHFLCGTVTEMMCSSALRQNTAQHGQHEHQPLPQRHGAECDTALTHRGRLRRSSHRRRPCCPAGSTAARTAHAHVRKHGERSDPSRKHPEAEDEGHDGSHHDQASLVHAAARNLNRIHHRRAEQSRQQQATVRGRAGPESSTERQERQLRIGLFCLLCCVALGRGPGARDRVEQVQLRLLARRRH